MSIKTKFRFPEIIFGMLLAVAIFAMGMVFESSRSPQSDAQQTANNPSASIVHAPDKITDWLLVGLNLLLVVSTGLLWSANNRSAKISERALTQLERAYVVPEFDPVERAADVWHVQISLSNVGKSFAIIKDLSARFAEPDGLPVVRPESGYEDRATDTVLHVGKHNWNGLAAFEMPTKQEGQIIYGHILYEDIFERLWRNRFAYEVWSEQRPGQDFYVITGGASYNAETQEG
jgi:hypothetical protein